VLFYICYEAWGQQHEKFANTVILCVSIAFVTVIFYTGCAERWYASTLCFPLGLILNKNFERLYSFYSSKKILSILIVFMGLLLSLVSLKLPQDSFIGMVILRNLFCISIFTFTLIFLKYFEFRSNILKHLTKVSTEIYLYQFPIIFTIAFVYRNKGIEPDNYFGIITLAILLTVASIFGLVGKKFKNVLT
jgi:peptidoglycan/LPS O-acetylase OafA/YrhL